MIPLLRTALGVAASALALTVSLGTAVAATDVTSPTITAAPASVTAGKKVIAARVQDDSQVSTVTLYYRTSGETSYASAPMTRTKDDVYTTELKQATGIEKGPVEYYLVAQDTAGNQSILPDGGGSSPLRTALSDDSSTSAPEVVLGSPDPSVVQTNGDLLVMVSFFRTGRDIDYNTIRLRIDKVDRTSEAQLVGNTLVFEPRRPLADGPHEIEVLVRDTSGEPLGPNVWKFQVKSRMSLPLGAEGDFYLGLQRDDRSINSSNIPLWNNKMDIGLRGQTGFLSWRAGVMLSSEETSFLTTEELPDRQPINRYYFEGTTRHFRARVGDSNPVFSDLSLNGILVRGLNLEFKSNRFNANAVYGMNMREIGEEIQLIGTGFFQIDANTFYNAEGDTISTASSTVVAMQDPNNPSQWNIYEFMPGTPERTVTGLKLDVTPIRNRLASWKFGVNFFGAEDDSSSLSYRYDADAQTRYYAFRDSTFYTDYKPKKNWVGTIETSLSLNNNQTVLSAEFGGTIVTENMFSYVSEDIQKDLPDQIDADLFLINGSTQTSFDKLKLKNSTSEGLADAIMSVYTFKFNSVVPIPKTSTRFRAEAYKTPTHYVSLGNPQQKTDIAGFKMDLKTRILKDQVSFDVAYDAYSDNLNSERKQYSNTALDQKDLIKDTSIASVSVSFMPQRWEKYAPSVTLGYRTYEAVNDLDLSVAANDTANMVDASTNTLLLNLGATLPVGAQRHSGVLSLSNMSIADNRPVQTYDRLESDNTTILFNLNSQINPLPLTITASLGHTGNTAYHKIGDAVSGFTRKEVTTGITLFQANASYKWFRARRLKTTAGFGYIGSSNGESGAYELDNSKISLNLEADYQLTSVTSVGALVRFHSFTDNVDDGNNYTEPILGLNLRAAF